LVQLGLLLLQGAVRVVEVVVGLVVERWAWCFEAVICQCIAAGCLVVP
jgi:hypothetical protein